MAQMTLTFLVALGFSSNIMMLAHASEFLKAPKVLSERISEEDINNSLLDEVEGSMGKGSTSKRLSEIEATLRPIVAALPKNAHGNMERSAISYALHRLFVARHGWVINGLGKEASKNHSASPAGVLKDQVPAYIAALFEERLNGKGFALRELAILASTIEHLIHNEAVSRLGVAFNVHQLSVTGSITKDEATEVLDTYMMGLITGENLNDVSLASARSMNQAMPEVFLAWGDTQKYVDGVRKSIIKDDSTEVDFASLARVVEIAGEKFGDFQDIECQQMKESLVKMEYRGTGRVRLSDFYKPALQGAWTFQEGSGYLRSLGALDESTDQPSVVIPNYVYAPTNCIASSGFYSVCCKNECEGLLGNLEVSIASPEAKAATIVSLISSMPSRYASAPQKLSASLLQRLDKIAATHSGMVPLHSRLFAQWMHHVYPRECPYPHITGTIDSKDPAEWVEANGNDVEATEEEMKKHVARAVDTTNGQVQDNLAVEDLTPWSDEEELIVCRPTMKDQQLQPTGLSAIIRGIAFCAASGSFAFAIMRTLQKTPSCGSRVPLGNEKYLV